MGHAFAGSLINENDGIEKLTLVPRGNTQGTTWTIPSVSQYNSRNIFVNQVLTAIGGRAAEEMINGTSECTVGAQMDLAQLTRILRTMVLRYAMARLQELNNIIDSFTTNFMDITYNEILAFLSTTRPGGERLVDQLMISEELTGKELRTIIREYISNLSSSELLYDSRKSSLFELLAPELKKSISEVENEREKLS